MADPFTRDAEADGRRAVAAEMAERAGDLLTALSADQRDAATFAIDDDERTQWFYTPTDHGGLPLGRLSPSQQRLAWRLVASGLSDAGYNTTALIVGLENVLDHLEGFSASWGRERGRDPLLYWIAVFGDPSSSGTWSWRLGGHHVSLHFVIVDGAVASTTPCFMGADPAAAPLLGPHLLRPLAAAEDLGRELVRSLRADQASAAILSSAPPADLVSVNRTALREDDATMPLPLLWRGRFEAEIDGLLWTMQERLEQSLGGSAEELDRLSFSQRPKGIAASELDSGQRDVLTALLHSYVDRIDDRLADHAWRAVEDSYDELHVLWAGSLEPGEPHYYRVQGGDLFVEYDNAQRGGNHVHTVWRDLRSDFGGDGLAEHYVHGHAH